MKLKTGNINNETQHGDKISQKKNKKNGLIKLFLNFFLNRGGGGSVAHHRTGMGDCFELGIVCTLGNFPQSKLCADYTP